MIWLEVNYFELLLDCRFGLQYHVYVSKPSSCDSSERSINFIYNKADHLSTNFVCSWKETNFRYENLVIIYILERPTQILTFSNETFLCLDRTTLLTDMPDIF